MKLFFSFAVLFWLLAAGEAPARSIDSPAKWACQIKKATGLGNSFSPPIVGDKLILDLNNLPTDELVTNKNPKRNLLLRDQIKIVQHDRNGARLASDGLIIDVFNPGAFTGVVQATMWITDDDGTDTVVNHISHFFLECKVQR